MPLSKIFQLYRGGSIMLINKRNVERVGDGE
jgi:hypothetical protein